MKILLVVGSGSKDSHTLALLYYIKEILELNQAEVQVWNLVEHPLPFVLPEYHKNPLETPSEAVRKFAKSILSCDGLVLGTPYYNGSYSGILKNALDCLNKDILRNKPVGLVSNGGHRATNALDHLRSVVRALYGYSLQTQVATHASDYEKINDRLQLTNDDMKERSQRFVMELLHFARILKEDPLL